MCRVLPAKLNPVVGLATTLVGTQLVKYLSSAWVLDRLCQRKERSAAKLEAVRETNEQQENKIHELLERVRALKTKNGGCYGPDTRSWQT